jgi:Tripartite tricarboxylate transporter TctB family
MIKIRSPQDLGAALIFLGIGLAGLYFGTRLSGIKPDGQLGSGTMPYILCWICIGFSAVMLFRALRVDGPAVASVPWRAVAAVTIAVILFGFLVEQIGYVLTAIITPLVATLALPDLRWKEAILVSVLLGVGTAVLFIYLLGQPLNPFPGAQ